MNKNASIILAGLLGISLLIPGGILTTAYAQSEYSDIYAQYEYSDIYAQPEYSDSYGYEDKDKRHDDKKENGYEDKDKRYDDKKVYGYEDKEMKYSDIYGYEDKEKKYSDSYGYEKKEDKKNKLIIQKQLFQCLEETTTPGEFEFCADDFDIDDPDFVDCTTGKDDACLDDIKVSDFQIDVIPAVQGSKHPINFDIDQTKYKVDEQFRLNDIGDILCFFANSLVQPPTHFNDGGIYETADERHFAVCADYVGDCDVNENENYVKDDYGKDDFRSMSYQGYDNGYKQDDYKIPQKCTVKNYVFGEFDLDNTDLNSLTQTLQSRAP